MLFVQKKKWKKWKKNKKTCSYQIQCKSIRGWDVQSFEKLQVGNEYILKHCKNHFLVYFNGCFKIASPTCIHIFWTNFFFSEIMIWITQENRSDQYVEGIVYHNFVLSYVNIKVNLNLRNKHVFGSTWEFSSLLKFLSELG